MPSEKPIDVAREKLGILQEARASASGAAQQFDLEQEIKKQREYIRLLEGQGSVQDFVEQATDLSNSNLQGRQLFCVENFARRISEVAYPWNADDLAKHIRGLLSGTLFISSMHDDVLRAAAQEVSMASEFSEHRVFSVSPNADDSIDLVALLNQAHSLKVDVEKNPSGSNVVFVIQASRFLISKLPTIALSLRSLPGRGVHMLFMVPEEELEERGNTAWHRGLDHWTIDALPLLLHVQQYRGASTDAELSELITQIRPPGGRTRAPHEEKNLVDVVELCLRDNGIDGVKRAITQGRLGGRVTSAELTGARNRWAKAGSIEQAALFLAVSFPNLTWESFEYLLPPLLAGKNEFVTKTTPGLPSKDEPNVPRSVETVPMPALTRWQEAPHALLAEAGLCCVEGPGADMVQFIEPVKENALREALTFHANISRDMYDSLHAHGVYFDPNTPASAVVNLARATRRLVSRAGESYNEYWLHHRVRDIQRWVGKKKTQETRRIEAGSFEQLFKSLIRAEENGRNLESFFFNRLCDLCSQLLSEPKTAPVVNKFIQLIVEDQEATGHHVLQIVRRLNGHEAFKHLPWIKHLFNSGDASTCQGALQMLFSEESEPRRFWKVCLEIIAWLPDSGEPIKHQCQRWAFAFLPLWFVDTVQRHQPILRRDPASRIDLPLFADAIDIPPLAERLQAASKLLCHPLFPESTVWVLRKLQREDTARPESSSDTDDANDNDISVGHIDYLVAEMLERWHGFLGASDAIPEFIAQLRDDLPKPRLVRVREFLRWKANDYQSRRSSVSATERSVIDRLVRQTRALEKLLYPRGIAGRAA
jgi:hypothetical protein